MIVLPLQLSQPSFEASRSRRMRLRTLLPALLSFALCCAGGLPAASAGEEVEISGYVDTDLGSDLGQGTEADPWLTLEHARSQAGSGEVIKVRGTNTVSFSESLPPKTYSDFVTFRADPEVSPMLSGITLDYADFAEAFLRFEGFQIHSSGRSTVVDIRGAQHVEISHGSVSSEWPAYGSTGVVGVRIRDSKNVTVFRNKVHTVHRTVQVGGSQYVHLIGNYLTPSTGTAIQWLGGNSGGRISANHIHRLIPEGYESGSEPGYVPSPHASIISIRSSDLVIDANLMYGLGSSSGIMMYDDDVVAQVPAYNNITIQNNLIYNIPNNYALRFYKLGENIKIRNNLVFRGYRTADTCEDGAFRDARYRYHTALQVHSLGEGADGSGLSVHNNVFIGRISIPGKAQEGNNIVWSWQSGGDWLSESPSGTSKIVTSAWRGCGNHSKYFEDGTFLSGEIVPPEGQVNHPSSLGFAEASDGINFGDPSHQSSHAIGRLLDTGFLELKGVQRSRVAHSVGPFERSSLTSSTPPPTAPILSVE